MLLPFSTSPMERRCGGVKEEEPKGNKAASSTSASLAGERSGRVELGLGVHRGTLDGEDMVCSIYFRVLLFPAAPLSRHQDKVRTNVVVLEEKKKPKEKMKEEYAESK
ncbi:hypothetical protein BHE74_00054428 [Ensete ventricosum]|nr:hypothetical protein BHE74_00054428 [Ensete ventricosum]